MSQNLYWKYHFRDSSLEKKIAGDSKEHQGVWGLTEGIMVNGKASVSVSDSSKFIIDRYNDIYDQMMDIFLYRCWRFPDCYVAYQDEEFMDPTLIIRRRLADTPLPYEVKQRTENFLEKNAGDNFAIVDGLSDYNFKKFSETEDFDVRAAWDVYRYRVFRKYGARILIVEDCFTEERWAAIRKRVLAARRVKVEKNGKHTFSAQGSLENYDVNVERLTCTCPDFQRRSRHVGMHCKHLVAALQQQGLWKVHWRDDIPEVCISDCRMS